MVRNHSSPQVRNRKLLAAVAPSIIRYYIPVWAEAMDRQWHRQKLDRVQRPLAQSIMGAFHSTNCEVSLVLAEKLPSSAGESGQQPTDHLSRRS